MKLKKIDSIDQALNLFTSEDSFRPAINNVHFEDGQLWATNGHTGICIDADLVDGDYQPVEKFPDLKKLFDDFGPDQQPDCRVSLADLENCLKKFEEHPGSKTCQSCYGTCERFCDECNEYHKCGCCDGDGVVENPYEITYGFASAIQIGDVYLDPKYVEFLYHAAKQMIVTHVDVFNGNSQEISGKVPFHGQRTQLFRISPHCKVLIMPINPSNRSGLQGYEVHEVPFETLTTVAGD